MGPHELRPLLCLYFWFQVSQTLRCLQFLRLPVAVQVLGGHKSGCHASLHLFFSLHVSLVSFVSPKKNVFLSRSHRTHPRKVQLIAKHKLASPETSCGSNFIRCCHSEDCDIQRTPVHTHGAATCCMPLARRHGDRHTGNELIANSEFFELSKEDCCPALLIRL